MSQLGKIVLVGCSNGQPASQKEKVEKLRYILQQMGFDTESSAYIYEKNGVFSGTAKERAEAINDFYKEPDIKMICDISGGDIANEILPYLDFALIAGSNKIFWGYSDLTTIINAIYTMTGKESVLYQIRNLIQTDSVKQTLCFERSILAGKCDLFSFSYHFLQKEKMRGIVVGGNIRCLLKLAGTKYWPDMIGKILFLESNGGKVPQMVAYLNQLQQMGVFEQINGILLGTFTQMQQERCEPTIEYLVKNYVGEKLPIAITADIGHADTSRALKIGKNMLFDRRKN